MNFDSLGMIETNGLVSSLVALNKMLEIGNVEFLKKEVITNGQVTLFVMGNVTTISHSIEAGVIAAQNSGIVLSSGVIPYPNEVIEKILFETESSKNKSKKVTKRKKKEVEEIATLFDLVEDETSSKKDDLRRAENSIKKEEEFDSVSDLLAEEKTLINNNEKVLKKHDKNVDLVIDENIKVVKRAELERMEEAEINHEIEEAKIKENEEDFKTASKLLIEEKNLADNNIEILKIYDTNVDLVLDDDVVETASDEKKVSADIINDEIDENILDIEIVADETIELAPEIEKELVSEVDTNDEKFEVIENEKLELFADDNSDESLKVDVAGNSLNQEELSEEDNSEISDIEESINESSDLDNMTHLERLRAEAKAEIETEKVKNLTDEKIDNSYIEDSANNKDISEVEEEKREAISIGETKDSNSEYLNELSKMNVPDLRKLARSKDNFPIKGREISKANRKLLLEYFSQI